MNSVYAAPSLRGPAAQLAFKLHAEAAGEVRGPAAQLAFKLHAEHDSQAVADTEQ
jgi:hypothetical protein